MYLPCESTSFNALRCAQQHKLDSRDVERVDETGHRRLAHEGVVVVEVLVCKQINRSHTHTHTHIPTENNTPDTDTHTTRRNHRN